jgi:peroxiredoxin
MVVTAKVRARRVRVALPLALVYAPILLVVASTALLAGCNGDRGKIRNGDPAPVFELPLLQGGTVAFPGDLEGQVVVLRFWADWCPFCASEMKDIEPLYRKHRERGLKILAINVRQDSATAGEFVARIGISYGIPLDRDGAVARSYGVAALPTTFIVDRAGRVATRILGESTPDLLEHILQGLL